MRSELWSVQPDEQTRYLNFAGGSQFFRAVSLAMDYSTDPFVSEKSAQWLINAKGMIQEVQSVHARAGGDLKARDDWAEEALVTLQSIQNRLPTDGVYIDILRYLDTDFTQQTRPSPRYAAWIVPKTGSVTQVDLGDALSIDRTILKLRKALGSMTAEDRPTDAVGFQELSPHLEQLSSLLWHPIEQRSVMHPLSLFRPTKARG